MTRSSEIHAYIFIKERLEELGWNVSNPEKNASGEVYTQHECLKNALVKKYLLRDVPENLLVVRQKKFLVVEAKASQKEIDKAEKEAKEYGDKLNQDQILCPMATAIAGNPEEGFLVRNFYFKNGKWESIVVNEKEIRGLPSRDIAHQLVDGDTNIIKDLQVSDEVLYKKATKINEILHLGSINKNARARVIAALLLAMADDVPIDTNNDTSILVSLINAKVLKILDNHKKREFADRIAITTPTTPDNHVKFRKALVDTIQELEDLNIRSAMNSGTDVLGRFYEIFLKYGNGAKEIGIVLTPRHITGFATKAIRVNKNDKVFDPACGTGGFLVASYDQVKKNCSESELEHFKKSGLYGIEQEAEVVALALVNMIFRGDGKNNIVEGNCFAEKYFKEVKMTKILMNPPFALKKEDEKEYRFVDFALGKMETGGLLFAVVPSPIMFRDKGFKEWRKRMLSEHTLRAVIKLPIDLFYPVGVHTSIIIIEAHRPHDFSKKVLWGYLEDGFIKKKGVRKEHITDKGNMSEMMEKIHTILDDHSFKSKPKQWIAEPIENTKFIECSPEQYLEDTEPTKDEIKDGMKKVLLNTLGGLMTRGII